MGTPAFDPSQSKLPFSKRTRFRSAFPSHSRVRFVHLDPPRLVSARKIGAKGLLLPELATACAHMRLYAIGHLRQRCSCPGLSSGRLRLPTSSAGQAPCSPKTDSRLTFTPPPR